MALGFTPSRATTILSEQFQKSYVGLSTTVPKADGSNFNELKGGGYARGYIGGLNTSIPGQVANSAIIFMFEATANLGSVSGFGVFSGQSGGGTPFYVGEITGGLSIGEGYVPLIRANTFVVGLDVDVLGSYQ